MAGEETTNQGGNIRPEFNTANTGLNLDLTVNQIPKGALTYALNASVENFDASAVNYQNEPGNELCLNFPEGYQLIGDHSIYEKNKHVFFLANPTTGDSEIGYMINNDCVYHTLVNAPCLNFNIDNPIHKVVHRITNCTTEIYWTDGLNPRRYLDIDNIPYVESATSEPCDEKFTNELDCNAIKIQPNFSIPQLDVIAVNNGGDLIAGTYQFAVQYSDASGNGYSSYYSVTNPTPIADTQITTLNFNYPVGKSIDIQVSNIDTRGQWQYFNIAVIKTINNITSVELIGTYFIDESVKQITYTGQNQELIRLTINDIFEKFPYYEVAQDLTAVRDILVWDQLTSIDQINYQKIANQITLQWQTYKLPATENYADELNATNLRGYLRDEVYPFEIVFLLKNGKQTDGFHIPGRAITANDQVLIYPTNEDFIGQPDPITGGLPAWKIYNTANVIGTALGDPINNATPYEYGEFAYWESTETYPCNTEVWGDLANQPIRHHKFPDVLVSPIMETRLFGGVDGMVMGNNSVFPIGVKVDISQILELISSSDLTIEQKNDIQGFKIVRGDRSTNKSVVAKGILRNVGKYSREEQDFYFPNYPYNDISEDPFINANNNAWTQLCNTYTIDITKLATDPNGGPDFAELEYTDCNSNKLQIKKFYEIAKFEFCSIAMPKILSPAEGTTSEATYEVWRIASTGGALEFCGGWRAEWIDPSGETQTAFINGWPENESKIINVKLGTEPVCIEYCGRCGITRQYLSTVYATTDCKVETPQPPIIADPAGKYRQIFNSPETSFGQPFLGDVLKLESVLFGKGLAHFVEVKGNAKYKLLTAEAQEDALNSSRDLADITTTFNASAMFAAYQSYLTIYTNGITRKNYAYSFNSIADYNYTNGVPNGLGVKQRELDIAQYLIPGVQSVGDDDVNINNFQRESSVFLRTVGSDGSITALPFPDKSPYMLEGSDSIITERSRFTISEIGNCATPAKETPIQVVSYYASLKNTFVNQWGQIYSYDTIDTGFQYILGSDESLISTVFGGDTFISRFAFKTKLPFFIDNRVNAPDDSDIFYDEIGNIAYPVYWHSARSILKDYSFDSGGTLPTVLSNIISYKAHNFDCPNSQELAEGEAPDQNPNRTFYDGYFYLFAYGIPNFYCETSYNLDLRQAFNNKEGDFWPHVSTGIPDDWVQENNVSIAFDNTYYYNVTFSKQNKENFFSHLPVDYTPDLCSTTFPFRAIYSDPETDSADDNVNNWLIYRAAAKFDFPQNYGKLVSLDGIQNKAILARFENKSLLYGTLLTINTSNPQAAYIGNPSLFTSSPPIDFAETDLGYVGTQNKMLLKIPQGQVTVDAKRGQVFLIQGTQVKDLSAFGSGMNKFFTNNLEFEILKYFPDVDTDNHFNGIGLHGTYDSKYDRVILTKLDYTPKRDDVKYDNVNKSFYIVKELIPGEEIREEVYLVDEDYFCNKSWTVSYSTNTGTWTSFHSYLPNFYIAENNFFYSGLNDCCSTINAIVAEVLPEPTTTSTSSTSSTTTTSSSSTTSTTTTRFAGCDLEGVAETLDCTLEGVAVDLTPTTTTTTTVQPEIAAILLFQDELLCSADNTTTPTAIIYLPVTSPWFVLNGSSQLVLDNTCPIPSFINQYVIAPGDFASYTVSSQSVSTDPPVYTEFEIYVVNEASLLTPASQNIIISVSLGVASAGGCDCPTTTTTSSSTSTSTSTTTTTTTSVPSEAWVMGSGGTGYGSSAGACGASIGGPILYSGIYMGVGTVFYTDAGLTTPFNGGSLWYKLYNVDSSYDVIVEINASGVVINTGSCSSTTSTTTTIPPSTTTTTTTIASFEWILGGEGDAYGSTALACADSSITGPTVYTNTTDLCVGVQFYADAALTAPIALLSDYYYRIVDPITFDVLIVGIGDGSVTVGCVTCPSTTTTTTTVCTFLEYTLTSTGDGATFQIYPFCNDPEGMPLTLSGADSAIECSKELPVLIAGTGSVTLNGPCATTTTTTTTIAPTTTTTTTSSGVTVYYEGFAACSGETVSFDISGYDNCTGTNCSGVVYNVAVGTLLTASNTNGPKAAGFCTNVSARIGTTSGGNEIASDSDNGIAVTAQVSYTVTSGSPSVIYLNAGLFS